MTHLTSTLFFNDKRWKPSVPIYRI